MKTYVSPEEIETPIVIYLHILWKWLDKLEYEYKSVYKDVLVDEHKWADIIKDCKNFLKRLERLKPYIIKFEKDNIIKPRIYPANYAVGGNERQPIIVITYDKCIFFANNRIWRA